MKVFEVLTFALFLNASGMRDRDRHRDHDILSDDTACRPLGYSCSPNAPCCKPGTRCTNGKDILERDKNTMSPALVQWDNFHREYPGSQGMCSMSPNGDDFQQKGEHCENNMDCDPAENLSCQGKTCMPA
mmetsp:Transcript_36165/g.86645  ORF Transcript_36165/g.86645 Transcript_36165/m.86645 type:complete len:130 (+) Transcript_36165:51-440(+)